MTKQVWLEILRSVLCIGVCCWGMATMGRAFDEVQLRVSSQSDLAVCEVQREEAKSSLSECKDVAQECVDLVRELSQRLKVCMEGA